jgi:hypothetical protein
MSTMRKALVLAALALAAFACDRGGSARPEPKIGSRPLAFDPALVGEVTLSVHGPGAGQGAPWTASIQLEPGQGWRIGSAPGGATLADRLADGGFLVHLLDSLTTLQYTEEPPRGPLASYGLDPPHHALRLKEGSREHELALGAEIREGGRYALLAGTRTVMIVRGSALRMLELLTGFEVLRRRTLATWATDDIDEVELWEDKRRAFAAERAGDAWVDGKGRRLRADVTAWLDAITHLRIRQFIDDPAAAAQIESELRHAPGFRIVSKDRRSRELVIAARRDGNVLRAIASTRPGAAFELHPEALAHFRPPPAK